MTTNMRGLFVLLLLLTPPRTFSFLAFPSRRGRRGNHQLHVRSAWFARRQTADDLLRETLDKLDKRTEELLDANRELMKVKDEANREMMKVKEADVAAIRHAYEVAELKHKLDVATGRLDARGLIESCVEDLWKKSQTTKREFKSDLRLKVLLSPNNDVCEGLVEYMKLTAEENGIPETEILGQSERLFSLLSARLHTTGTQFEDNLPAAMFESFGKATMIAFAAFAQASGRDVKLYGYLTDVTLRVPPDNICDVTRDTLLKRPFLSGAPLPSLSSDGAGASSSSPGVADFSSSSGGDDDDDDDDASSLRTADSSSSSQQRR